MLRHIAPPAILTILFLTIAPQAHADGMFVWRNQDIDIREPQQKAFIIHEDGLQDLVLSVKFEGAPADFGWLVPFPSRPEMKPVSGPVFETLSQMMQEPFAPMSQKFAGLNSSYGGDAGKMVATHHDVGLYDITLLEGGDGEALEAWLGMHGYSLPGGAAVVLDEYAEKGWTLAAIKIDPEQIHGTTGDDLKNGEIDPIHFRFATEESVFPLRISSLNGHPSEILLYVLAERPQRPAIEAGISWEISLKPWQEAMDHIWRNSWAVQGFDSPPIDETKSSTSFMRELSWRINDRTDDLWLAKYRATVSPEAMVDLVFTDLELSSALKADDLGARVGAVSYTGMAGDISAVPLLVEFLAGHEVPRTDCNYFVKMQRSGLCKGQDFRSSLWALGLLKDRRAVAEVRRWASSGQPLYQIDALDALRMIDPKAATEVSLDILEQGDRESKSDYCVDGLYSLALTTIMEFGGPEAHSRLANPELGPDAVAMAAACGDSSAQVIVEQWLTESASLWCHGLADGDSMGTKGLRNGYPPVLYPLSEVATRHGAGIWQGKLRTVFKALRRRSGAKDEILRHVASNDSLSGMSRAILLSEITEPTIQDIALLRQLWHAAREHPRRVWLEYRGSSRGRVCPLWSEFDLDAFAVAYALASLGEHDLLLSLWYQVPWLEAELRGEILVALITYKPANSPAQTLFSVAEKYMLLVWNTRIRDLDRSGCYTVIPGRWPYPESFDLPHRETAFKQLYRGKGVAEAANLVENSTLDPAVQLYWVDQSWRRFYRSDPEWLDQQLHQISARLDDPVLIDACDRIIHNVAELDAKAGSAP